MTYEEREAIKEACRQAVREEMSRYFMGTPQGQKSIHPAEEARLRRSAKDDLAAAQALKAARRAL